MVIPISAEDKRISIDKSGKMTIRREIIYDADSIDELAMSTALPRENTRNPILTDLYLESLDVDPIGNENRRVQARATLNYVSSVQNSGVMHFGGEPWELGAQNVQISFIERQVPLISGTGIDGTTIIQAVNSAGCQILAETTETVMVLSFMFSVKAKTTNDWNSNMFPVINKTTETVAGITIPEYMGKLLPMSANYVVEYDTNGTTVKRRYWNYNAQIQISASGWAKRLLDVGTMARFKEKSDDSETETVRKYPENIYKYTPWNSADMTQNMKIAPKFGNIESVIKAMNDYWTVTGGKEKIPYEEVTEPIPLRDDGTIYTEALENPKLYPYREIELYDCEIGSWNAYNLPREVA